MNGPGTFPYMAPEMFRCAHRGPPVDVYSLGCLFIELFGSKSMWGELTNMEIMQKVCGAYNVPPEMPSVEHLDHQLRPICKRCCQLDAAARPLAREVLKMIQAVFVDQYLNSIDVTS